MRDDTAALLRWVAAIVVAGVVLAYLGIMRHRTMTFVREDATARSAGVLLRHLARIGAVLPRRLAAGEVATVGGSDIGHTSQVLTMTGPGVGAVVAYAVVAVVLWSVAPLLAVFVLLGVPAIVVAHRAAAAPAGAGRVRLPARSRASSPPGPGTSWPGCGCSPASAGAGCSPAGTPPGRRGCCAEGYRVGAVNSWIEALTFAIPGFFLAAVVWLAARMAADGDDHDRADGRRLRVRGDPHRAGLVPARGRSTR